MKKRYFLIIALIISQFVVIVNAESYNVLSEGNYIEYLNSIYNLNGTSDSENYILLNASDGNDIEFTPEQSTGLLSDNFNVSDKVFNWGQNYFNISDNGGSTYSEEFTYFNNHYALKINDNTAGDIREMRIFFGEQSRIVNISFWFYTESMSKSPTAQVLGNTYLIYRARCESNNLYVDEGGTSSTDWNSRGSISTNTWTHYRIQLNTNTNTAKTYIDSELRSTCDFKNNDNPSKFFLKAGNSPDTNILHIADVILGNESANGYENWNNTIYELHSNVNFQFDTLKRSEITEYSINLRFKSDNNMITFSQYNYLTTSYSDFMSNSFNSFNTVKYNNTINPKSFYDNSEGFNISFHASNISNFKLYLDKLQLNVTSLETITITITDSAFFTQSQYVIIFNSLIVLLTFYARKYKDRIINITLMLFSIIFALSSIAFAETLLSNYIIILLMLISSYVNAIRLIKNKIKEE
mgnify:CR=1 FL=1